MMIRWIRGVILSVFFVVMVLLSGCGKESDSPSAVGGSARTNRIGIQGSNGTFTVPHGQPVALTADPALVDPGTTVEQKDFSSRARIIFPSGAVAEIKGLAHFSIHSAGLSMIKGKFVGEFRRIEGKQFEVRVPYAILGIKGTRVQFDLQAETGKIQLLEGKVEVVPENSTVPIFVLIPGQSFSYQAGKIIPPKSSGTRSFPKSTGDGFGSAKPREPGSDGTTPDDKGIGAAYTLGQD